MNIVIPLAGRVRMCIPEKFKEALTQIHKGNTTKPEDTDTEDADTNKQ